MKKYFWLAIGIIASLGLEAQESRFVLPDGQTKTETSTTAQPAAAESTPKSSISDLMDRLRFGGNVGMSFNSYYTFLNLSPRVYYMANEKLWLGSGLTFIWTKYDNYLPPYDEQFVWGFNFSAQQFLMGPLFLHAEYEPLSFDSYQFDPFGGVTGEERIWAHALMLGGGLAQPMGRGMTFISVMYNVLWVDQYQSYYSSPWVIRIGAGF